MSEQHASKVPLIDLLNGVPEDSRMTWEYIGKSHGGVMPIGRMCHDAAAELASLQKRIEKLEGVLSMYANEDNWDSHDGYMYLKTMSHPWGDAVAILKASNG